ncbi:DNA primase small subunit PriS [Pyrofollis japonicus]|uniref:DNA primase small subunit domain-containing protein n=1 Tax=Pyrofollis japonicus TaxID=3060460 RepID=UPI00295AAC92|nr:DNA primase small subunit domain-containing protein [Pyrofollis japonicus]BEP18110.1 DNA primase small subunit PriS [Pyrofollis japonicus]
MPEDVFVKTRRFLENITRTYYRKIMPIIPKDFMLREFAAQTWHGKSYIRHMSFHSIEEIRKFLIEKAPRHFYFSSARYNEPEAPSMDQKGWRSSDLVFDIDADHLPECKEKVVEINIDDEKVKLVDDECIEKAAFRAIILKDILVYELGIDKNSISVEFSGNRGFHVTAYLDDSHDLARSSSDVRREIVNYIKAVDIDEKTLMPWTKLSTRSKPMPILPSFNEAGIRGRIARIMYRLAHQRKLKSIANKILLQKDLSKYDEVFEELEHEARQYISVEIDEQVSIDVSRLIRAPLSLHGKSLLPVKPLSEEELEKFRMTPRLSPFINEEPIRVRILADIPQIRILGNRIRFRKNDRPRLDAPLALYFLSKGLALLV